MHEHTLPRPRTWHAGPGARALLALAAGLAVGSLTSVGQTYLSGASNAFVNSAGAWLVVPFFAGSSMRSSRGAMAAGLAVCAAELVGYYATATLRGFSSGSASVVYWSACAVLAGPVFGAAGRLWRTRTDDLRGLGAAVLSASFLVEGTWVYFHVLHYYVTAALWLTIGAIFALTMMHGRERRWLPVAVVAGLAGEVILTRIHTLSV